MASQVPRSFGLSLAALLLCGGVELWPQEAPGTRSEWRQVWEDFADRYSYFERKRVDWDQVWLERAADFDSIEDGDAFAEQLHAVLLGLRDWHVFVRRPSGALLGFQEPVAFNFDPAQIVHTRYLQQGMYENLNDAGAVVHGWVGDGLAHILVLTLGDRFTQNISTGDIGNLFVRYESARAMIIDLRANGGGSELNAREFANRWTDTERVYGYVRTREPALGREGFSELQARLLVPSERKHFRGPVIGLIGEATISSGESFALMIRSLPDGVLIGDTTRGASGNPVLREVPSLGVAYSISTWQAMDATMELIEDHGVVPDLVVPAEESFDAERDYVLEAALDLVARRGEGDVPLAWVARNGLTITDGSDADGDGASDVAEYQTRTDPRDPDSVLRVLSLDPSGTGWNVCWSGASGVRYVLEWSPVVDFSREGGRLSVEPRQEEGPFCEAVVVEGSDAHRFFRVRVLEP